MTEKTDPVTEIIIQHNQIVADLKDNLGCMLNINMRKDQRLAKLEQLVRLYANPEAPADVIRALRIELNV